MTHEQLKKQISDETKSQRVGYCRCCDKQTDQTLYLLNPDQIAGFNVWQCNECLENIEIE